jgi:hypothetical protein
MLIYKNATEILSREVKVNYLPYLTSQTESKEKWRNPMHIIVIGLGRDINARCGAIFLN